MMNRDSIAPVIAAAAAVFFLSLGLWAFFDAKSFFDAIAGDFPPYNAHLIHDIGAFQAGLGATLGAALVWRRDALLAAMAGVGVGAAFHFAAHVIDHDHVDATTVLLGVLAGLLLAGAALKASAGRET